MRSGPVEIPGVAGQLVVETPMVGRPTVLVDGVAVPRLTRAVFAVPTTDGDTVPVQVQGGPGMSPHPRLVLGDEVHETGPRPPWWLQVLAVLPVLAVAVAGGAGGFVGVAGIVGTWAVLRRPWSLPVRAAGVASVVLVSLAAAWALRLALA